MKTKPKQSRQSLLNPCFAEAFEAHLADSALFWSQNQPEADSRLQANSLAAANVARDSFERLVLHYTAGEPLHPLRAELASVVVAHGVYQEALAAQEERPQMAPLGLERLSEYERCMQIIGLCYLLHRQDLLPLIAQWEDPGYSGQDALYEELLDYGLPDRFATDTLLHGRPFSLLVEAMFRESEEESVADIEAYCKAWYPAMSAAPWHDSHLRTTDTDGDYFGYWAFEAGAVAYLLNVDDSSIDHMVYPKDLVRFARDYGDQEEQDDARSPTVRLRVSSGQPCPRGGWWSTPARVNSRRRFDIGEVMPDLGGDYGRTLWQWDELQ